MSKSAPDANSRILLTDTPEQIRAKIKKAVTDSDPSLGFDPMHRPAVSNLLQILAGLRGNTLKKDLLEGEDEAQLQNPAFVAEVLNRLKGGSGAALKAALIDSIIEELRPIQMEYSRLVTEDGYLDSIEALGRDKAREHAQKTLQRVRSLLGYEPQRK
ncbi:Tryptophan--tRNA ligase, mitochondrial [Malassezia pachydermatis]